MPSQAGRGRVISRGLGPQDLATLIELLGDSGRTLRVFDNLGREMVRLLPGEGVRQGLTVLSTWLAQQREGHVTVPYVDIWAR